MLSDGLHIKGIASTTVFDATTGDELYRINMPDSENCEDTAAEPTDTGLKAFICECCGGNSYSYTQGERIKCDYCDTVFVEKVRRIKAKNEKKKLREAKNERNVRMYNTSTELWEWVTSTSDVKHDR